MEQETRTLELSNRFFLLTTILIVGLVVSYLGTLAYQFKSLPQNYPREIYVNGEGKTYAKPDVATATFGMHTQGLQSQEVVDKNNEVMGKVIQSVKDLGVEEKDIKTTMYNLAPIYDYTETGRIFKGYSLDQQVLVKIRDFNKISSILDSATTNGANTVGDLQFTVDDMEKVRAEARALAINQAKEKAASMAAQAGFTLEKLINVSEGYGGGPMPYGAGYGGMAVKESAAVAPQIETGQLEVTSMVTLSYRVR